MVRPKNPRYPHWCRIIRKTVEDPLEDEDDFSPLEGKNTATDDGDDFDPLGGDSDTDNTGETNEELNDVQDKTPVEEEDSSESEDGQTTVIYEGECRSYAKNTTSDKGEVIVSYRGLALPLTQDDWDALGIFPQEGDEIAVDRGAYKEYGRVIDREPANFGGTHLTWKYGRN